MNKWTAVIAAISLSQALPLPGWCADPAGVRAYLILDASNPVEAPAELDNSPSSPPLNTDDPGTPGRRGYEINFISNCDRTRDDRSCENGIDAAFGIGDAAQFRVSKSLVHESADGEPDFQGHGPTDVGVKYRFYDQDGLQIATFPSYQLDDGSRKANPDGSLAPSDGRSIYLPIIISKDILRGTGTTVVTNVGYRKNLDYDGRDTIFTGAAIGKALDSSNRVMGEVDSECSSEFRDCNKEVRVGYVHVLFPDSSSRYETSLFASVGYGIDADGTRHKTMLFGLNVTQKPD